MKKKCLAAGDRRSPSHPDGIRKVQVGCGPHNVLPNWWNVDIRAFKGVDGVMDVTKPWAWDSILSHVYGEHFLEHLSLDGAISFLGNAVKALRPGGKIRLSTPSLEWVLATHFDAGSNDGEKVVGQTFAVNRAFHGWGHQFLYSRPFLEKIILSAGFVDPQYFAYGESEDLELKNMERHGGFRMSGGFPSVWIVEARRSCADEIPNTDDAFLERCKNEYTRYVSSGH